MHCEGRGGEDKENNGNQSTHLDFEDFAHGEEEQRRGEEQVHAEHQLDHHRDVRVRNVVHHVLRHGPIANAIRVWSKRPQEREAQKKEKRAAAQGFEPRRKVLQTSATLSRNSMYMTPAKPRFSTVTKVIEAPSARGYLVWSCFVHTQTNHTLFSTTLTLDQMRLSTAKAIERENARGLAFMDCSTGRTTEWILSSERTNAMSTTYRQESERVELTGRGRLRCRRTAGTC